MTERKNKEHQKKMDSEQENIHEHHRQRMKKKFLDAGAANDTFPDHEILEMILYCAQPRKNTNDLGHKLLQEFGSVANVVEADYEKLKSIKGVGEHTAFVFKLIQAVINKYEKDKHNISKVILTPENIKIYIRNLFYGLTNEVAYAILLDANCEVKKVQKISTCTVNSAEIHTREIVKLAVNEKYPYLMLAHNHPNGNPLPSQSDIDMTKIVDKALSFIEVRLVDHVIVAGDEVISMAKNFGFFNK